VRIIVGLLTNTMQLFSVVHCVAGKTLFSIGPSAHDNLQTA